MKRRLLTLLPALTAACLLVSGGVGEGSSVPAPGIPRFQAVTESLFRGGQPTDTGFRFLKQKGIKTVVNLREENDERELVERLGMKYIHIPSKAWDPFPEQAIQTFFQVLNDPSNRPVFVHCGRGADRTGAMVGLFRIAFQGWDGKRAYQEARAMGMRWWYRDLKKQLYEFAEKPFAGQERARGN